jgi:hypothetical protein
MENYKSLKINGGKLKILEEVNAKIKIIYDSA